MKVLTHEKHKGCPAEIQDEFLNEDWAMKIHGQDLKTLNRRGGLAPNEIYGNIKRLDLRTICSLNMQQCVNWLIVYVRTPPTNI